MITDADIKKLARVFATKNDLVAMEKRQDQKYATKEEVTGIKRDLVEIEKRIKKDIVDDIVHYLQEHILPLLMDHDKRLDRLEKHVGGFPSIA